MNDPLASFTAPPPRYLLESDSSDEEGQGLYPILGQPSRPPRAPVVPHHYTVHPAGTQTYESVIVGIGQAGRYAARCLGIDSRRPGEVRLLDGDALVGQGYEVDGRLFMMLDETGPSGDGAHELSESLLSSLKAKRWVLSTSYLAALYIPDSEDPTATQDDSVIRFLHSGSQPDASPATMAKAGLRPLDSPNYVSGYAAALASLAAHPASPLPSDTPFTILALPLPLSSIANQRLHSALTALSVAYTPTKTGLWWSEDDDEPYTGQGQGARKPLTRTKGREDQDLSMYT